MRHWTLQSGSGSVVGLGAALSNVFGGKLVQAFSFRVSFLALGAVALAAFLLLLFAIPETVPQGSNPLDVARRS